MEYSDLPIVVEGSMVLVLGETGSGKSFFVKKLTSDVDVKVGHHLESCKPRRLTLNATKIADLE
jgi:ABC-type phosphate/phosphonate transport system ATPase subunit